MRAGERGGGCEGLAVGYLLAISSNKDSNTKAQPNNMPRTRASAVKLDEKLRLETTRGLVFVVAP